MVKVPSPVKTAASYLNPTNILNAAKCSGKIVEAAGKAVEFGGKTISNLSAEGKKLLDSYIQYLNQKNPDSVKENNEFGKGMESLLDLIGSASGLAAHIGGDLSNMGDKISHLGESSAKGDKHLDSTTQHPMIEGAA